MHGEFARHGIDSGELRDDLLHDLALKLMNNNWRTIRHFLANGESETFKPLLRTVIRSVVFDYFRSEKVWHRIQQLEEPAALANGAEQQFGSDPAQSYLRGQIVKYLLAAARSNQGRSGMQTLYLRYILGYSVKDIAEIMRVSPNTISQRLRYYLAKLGATGITDGAEE